MRQATPLFRVETRGRGLVDNTRPVADWLTGLGAREGLLTPFCRHTSPSLVVQANASPAVLTDLEAAFERLAPEAPPQWRIFFRTVGLRQAR